MTETIPVPPSAGDLCRAVEGAMWNLLTTLVVGITRDGDDPWSALEKLRLAAAEYARALNEEVGR